MQKFNKLPIYSADTGELTHFQHLPVLRRSKFGADAGQRATLFLEGVEKLATNKEITDSDCRVWLLLAAQIGFGNTVRMSAGSIATELGKTRQFVQNSLTRLEKAGFILISRKNGESSSIQISPRCCWMGKANELSKARSSFDKIRLAAADGVRV